MSESTSTTRARERDDHRAHPAYSAPRQALQAVQVSLDRRDNGGDGAAMLEK